MKEVCEAAKQRVPETAGKGLAIIVAQSCAKTPDLVRTQSAAAASTGPQAQGGGAAVAQQLSHYPDLNNVVCALIGSTAAAPRTTHCPGTDTPPQPPVTAEALLVRACRGAHRDNDANAAAQPGDGGTRAPPAPPS